MLEFPKRFAACGFNVESSVEVFVDAFTISVVVSHLSAELIFWDWQTFSLTGSIDSLLS